MTIGLPPCMWGGWLTPLAISLGMAGETRSRVGHSGAQLFQATCKKVHCHNQGQQDPIKVETIKSFKWF